MLVVTAISIFSLLSAGNRWKTETLQSAFRNPLWMDGQFGHLFSTGPTLLKLVLANLYSIIQKIEQISTKKLQKNFY